MSLVTCAGDKPQALGNLLSGALLEPKLGVPLAAFDKPPIPIFPVLLPEDDLSVFSLSDDCFDLCRAVER